MSRIGIYRITNIINGKSYIGKALDIDARWRAHRWHGSSETDAPTKKDSYLYRAMKKYGANNFNFEIIMELGYPDEELLNIMEKAFIREFHTFSGDPEYKGGYNETRGGEGVSGPITESRRQNIIRGTTGVPHLSVRGKPSGMTGKSHTEESRKKMSESNKGKHKNGGRRRLMTEEEKRITYTPEVRQRMSDAHKGLPPNIGWHHSEEAKKKMSEIRKGRSATNLGIPRTESQRELDRIIKLKAYLKRGQKCIKCVYKDSDVIQYFVSTNETAIKLTGLAGAMTTVQKIVNDPNWTSPKSNSKTWQMLKDWKIEYCSQSELLKHRLELA